MAVMLSPSACLAPLSPVLALAAFTWMHSLAAELSHERMDVLLAPKPKDLVPLPLPDNGVTEARQRQPIQRAELADLFILCAGAFRLD
jgi:hypothetical protein